MYCCLISAPFYWSRLICYAQVDEHFFDLKNKQGVTDSADTHVYNGVNWQQIRDEIDSKQYKDKQQAYKWVYKLYTHYVVRTI